MRACRTSAAIIRTEEGPLSQMEIAEERPDSPTSLSEMLCNEGGSYKEQLQVSPFGNYELWKLSSEGTQGRLSPNFEVDQ